MTLLDSQIIPVSLNFDDLHGARGEPVEPFVRTYPSTSSGRAQYYKSLQSAEFGIGSKNRIFRFFKVMTCITIFCGVFYFPLVAAIEKPVTSNQGLIFDTLPAEINSMILFDLFDQQSPESILQSLKVLQELRFVSKSLFTKNSLKAAVAIVQDWLTKTGVCLINIRNSKNETILHIACTNNDTYEDDSLRLLFLADGSKELLYAREHLDCTALHCAAFHNKVKSTQILIEWAKSLRCAPDFIKLEVKNITLKIAGITAAWWAKARKNSEIEAMLGAEDEETFDEMDELADSFRCGCSIQ